MPLRRPTERAGRNKGVIVAGAVAARPGQAGREDESKNMLNEAERTSCSRKTRGYVKQRDRGNSLPVYQESRYNI